MKREITFMLAVTAIGLIGVAQAETFNDSVTFPIPDNIAEIMKRCGIDKMDDAELIVSCQWKFTSEQIEQWYDELVEEQGLVDPEIAEPEQVDAPAPIESSPEYEPTPYERDLERFTDNPPKTEADKEYLALLQHLGECQRGYNESRGIQNNEWYAISHTWVNSGEAWLKSIDYTGRHQKLVMAIEECMAQRTILNPVVLGPAYEHKGAYFGQHQPYHGEMAITGNWEVIPTPDVLTVRDFNDAKQKAESICTLPSEYHCKMAEMKEQSYRDNQEVVIAYPSKILEKVAQYEQDGGDSMYRDLVKKSMQEHISKALERFQ